MFAFSKIKFSIPIFQVYYHYNEQFLPSYQIVLEYQIEDYNIEV